MKDITRERYDENGKRKLRRFHQARWDESIIFELSTPGERGILVPEPEDEVKAAAEDPLSSLPEFMRRSSPPALPEMGQLQVLRHYLRLSQENLGMDFNIDVGQGTCTMKYSPKINEQLASMPQIAELHPLQDERSVQGILQIYYEMSRILKEISGMAQFSFQPQAGSQAIYANVAMIRAYHASRGEARQRDEIITTIFSHPSNPACAKTAGYKITTLYPDADGYPDFEALKAALSNRTAALLITNPEDTGIYSPKIREFTRLVHEAGGLCCYDQANANGLLGIARASDAGFDLCHFNLHKTFSTPHGCGGPGGGVSGVSKALAKFLPVPVVTYDGEMYRLDYDRPESIGKIRSFFGVAPVVLKAYAWIMSLGAEGLRSASEIAVLNNNYLLKKMLAVKGVSAPYAEGKHRIEQVRYSLEKLAEETGVHSEEIGIRAADYGVHYWTSHHPYVVPEPTTLEPTESFSKADLDEYADILTHVCKEAYENPEKIKTAPHNSTVHTIDHEPLDDPKQWAVTWRAYLKKARKTVS